MAEFFQSLPDPVQDDLYHAAIYRCSKSYEENYQSGPRLPDPAFLNIPDCLVNYKLPFFHWQLTNPLGIPAGPLLNSLWVKFYLEFGFSVPVYKTVRSVFRACHPAPNCIYVQMPVEEPEFVPSKLLKQGKLPEVQSGKAPCNLQKLSITNSFGVPSMEPKIWMPDLELANSYCREGQLLIVSILGTEGAEGRNLVQDFAFTAAMACEAGAKVIEANFSCPNLVGSNSGMLYADAENAAQIARAVRQAIGKSTPLLLKIGYLAPEHLAQVVAATRPYVDGYAGINTVPSNVRNHNGTQALPGEGRLRSGVCGVAIRSIGRQFVQDLVALRQLRKDDFVVVGVGGMMSADDLTERLQDGADCVMTASAAMWDAHLALRWQAQQQKA